MGVGKYSPTVSRSYAIDQKWWERNGGGYGNGTNPEAEEDNDGFDSYGYAGPFGQGPDRAGYTEDQYATSYSYDEEFDTSPRYNLYDRIDGEWYNRRLGDLEKTG